MSIQQWRLLSLSVVFCFTTVLISQSNSKTVFKLTDEPLDEYPCDLDFGVEIKSYLIYPNGSIWDLSSSSLYDDGTYWEESAEKNYKNKTYRGCPCLLSKPCLRKCCMIGEVITIDGLCLEHERGRKFEPIVVEDDELHGKGVNGNEHFAFLFGAPQGCDKKFFLRPGMVAGDGYYIYAPDGYLEMYERNVTYGPSVFCIDLILDLWEYRPFLCEPHEEASFIMNVYPHLFMTSALSLLMTFLIYVIIPELRNGHGKILMCHVFSFFAMFLLFGMTQYLGRRLAYWMCVSAATPSERQDQRRFLYYSLYAWRSPTISFIVTAVIQFTPGLPDHIIKPHFGEVKCYFHTYKSLGAYLYGPITTLLISNVIMFVITTVKIYQVDEDSSILRRNCIIVNCIKERFILFIKLFIVMGLSWILDFIAWIMPIPRYYFYFAEVWNSLQGVFIFIIFVCKKGIINMLLQRICPNAARHLENRNHFHQSATLNCSRHRTPTCDTRQSNRNVTLSTVFPSSSNDETVI